MNKHIIKILTFIFGIILLFTHSHATTKVCVKVGLNKTQIINVGNINFEYEAVRTFPRNHSLFAGDTCIGYFVGAAITIRQNQKQIYESYTYIENSFDIRNLDLKCDDNIWVTIQAYYDFDGHIVADPENRSVNESYAVLKKPMNLLLSINTF